MLHIFFLLLLLSCCAGCVYAEVYYGKKLRQLKCSFLKPGCWGKDVGFMIAAGLGCLIATFMGLRLVMRLF